MDIVSLAVGLPPRAKTQSVTVSLVTGVVAKVSSYSLLAPVVFTKQGGSSNLTVNSTTGNISAAVALTAGQSQTISGIATGADNFVIPWSYTLVGKNEVPASSITGTPPTAIIGQAYDWSFTVTPAGSAVTLGTEFQAFLAAHSITHDGYGRLTSASVTA